MLYAVSTALRLGRCFYEDYIAAFLLIKTVNGPVWNGEIVCKERNCYCSLHCITGIVPRRQDTGTRSSGQRPAAPITVIASLPLPCRCRSSSSTAIRSKRRSSTRSEVGQVRSCLDLNDDSQWATLVTSSQTNYLQTTPRCVQCQHEQAPTYLSSLCSPLSAVTTRRQLRPATQGDLDYPRTRTVTYDSRAFAVSGPTCWNLLPSSLKSLSLKPAEFL